MFYVKSKSGMVPTSSVLTLRVGNFWVDDFPNFQCWDMLVPSRVTLEKITINSWTNHNQSIFKGFEASDSRNPANSHGRTYTWRSDHKLIRNCGEFPSWTFRGTSVFNSNLLWHILDIHIPPEEVFRVCFWGPNTFSECTWMSMEVSN